MADNTDAINAKLDEARDLMVEDGMDEGTANALIGFARPAEPSIVGNFADLQRMGAIAVSGKLPANSMPAGQDQAATDTSSINDAFAAPPEQPTDAELAAQSGVSPANTRTDEEAAARAAQTDQPAAQPTADQAAPAGQPAPAEQTANAT